MEPTERPRGSVRRILRAVVLGSVGLFALYLVAANLLLQTPFVESLTNDDPESLLITYRRGWTFFPGHLLAYGVTVRNQAPRTQLQISAEEAWAVINPLPLLHREVRILRGKVYSPRVWLRTRPATVEEQQADAPFVPPIEGLPFSLRAPFTPPSSSPWTVTVAAVEVFDVRDFWYQRLRVEGPGTVLGAFTVGPGPLVAVRWDLCDFPALKLSFRNEVVLPAAKLHSVGAIAPFDSDENDFARILPSFSGRAELGGTAPNGIAAVQPFLSGVPGLALSGDPLDYAIDVCMNGGVLEPGTRLTFRSARAAVSYGGLEADTGLDLSAAIGAPAPARALSIELALDRLRMRTGSSETGSADAQRVQLAVTVPDVSLVALPARVGIDLRVADLRLEDALDLPPVRSAPDEEPRLDFALRGEAHAVADATLDAGGAVSVHWGPVEIGELHAAIDGRPAIDGGRVTSDGRVGPIPRGGLEQSGWLSTLGGTLALELTLGPELSALDPLLGPKWGVSLSGAPTRLAVATSVEAGRLGPGTHVELHSERIAIRTRGVEARGAIGLRADLSGAIAAGAAIGSADLALRGIELRFPALAGTRITGDRLALQASAEGIGSKGLPRRLAAGTTLSGLRYEGEWPARALALEASVPGTVRIDAEATTPPGGATTLRWGPIAISPLAVRLAGQTLLDELRLETSGTLGPVRFSGATDARTLLAATTGRLQFGALTPAGLAAVNELLPPGGSLALSGDAVRYGADISLAHGTLVPGSRLDLKTGGIEVTASGVAARAAVDLHLRVEPPAAGPDGGRGGATQESEVALDTTLTGISVAHAGVPEAAGRGESLTLSAHAPLGALQGPRKEFDFALAVTELHLADVTRLDDPLPRAVQDDIGSDDLRLDASVGGTARVAGSLALGPGSTFLLRCDSLDFPHFDLDVDGTALLARATLAGNASLGPYDYGTRGRGGILPVTSGRAALTARTAAGLRALDNLLKSVTWLEIEGGTGFVTLDGIVENGTLKPGSTGTVQLDDLALKVTGFRAGGDADVRAWIGADEGGEFGALEAELSNVHVAREGTTGRAEADGVSLSARTRDLRLGRAPADVDVKLALRNVRLDKVVGLNSLFPKGTDITFTDGSARVDAELSGSSGGKDGRGSIRVHGERLAMSVPGYDFVGDVALDVPLSEGDLLAGRFVIDGATIDLTNFDVAGGETGHGSRTTGWWADIGVDDAALVLKGAITASGDVSFKMRDTAPIVQFFTSRTHIPRFLARAMDVRDVSGNAELSYSPERVEIRDLSVVSNRAQVEGRLQVDDRKPLGQLLVVYDWIGIGIGLDGKKTDVKLLGARHWYARLGPDPPQDLDAYVDQQVREWHDTRRELRGKKRDDGGDSRSE